MKHKHYDMIVAKAANMELVVFIKCQNEWKEQQCNDDQLNFSCGHDYFLCLPQHKEACFHWLNGGYAQFREMESSHGWSDYTTNPIVRWALNNTFMDKSLETRIRPKKEKRWIAISMSRGVCCELFESESEAMEAYPLADQFIEIEVEV